MATGTTSLETLPKDPNAIASTTNPVGNGMLNMKASDPAPKKFDAQGREINPFLMNAGAVTAETTGGIAPTGAGANSPAAGYTPALGTSGKATTATYTATPYAVAPGGLVENRIRDIVKGNSPLMQQAEQLANARSNDRGMLNSSIGTAAGQSAVLTAAAPIATTDAGAINQAMTNTANAQNAAGQFNAGEKNETSQLNANLLSQMNGINANAQNAALNLQAQARNNQIMSRLEQEQKLQMQTVLNDNAILLKNSELAGQLAQQTMTNIANIQMDDSLDATQKANAVAGQLNLMNESLRATQKETDSANTAIGSVGIPDIFGQTPGKIASPGITDLFGGGNATPENITGAGNTKPAATREEAQQNEASLRASYRDLKAKAEAEFAKARAIPNQRGGKALREPFVAAAAEFKRQAVEAASRADRALVEVLRLGTPEQYQRGLAGYQANLDRAKAAFAALPSTVPGPPSPWGGSGPAVTNPALAQQRNAIARYTTIVNGLKTAGYPTQAAVDAKVDAVYKTYTIPTYTTSADAKTGYDRVAQMATAETDPVKKAALVRARDQIGLNRINQFYTPAQKTAMKADYTTKLAAVTATKDAHAMAYYNFYLKGIK